MIWRLWHRRNLRFLREYGPVRRRADAACSAVDQEGRFFRLGRHLLNLAFNLRPDQCNLRVRE